MSFYALKKGVIIIEIFRLMGSIFVDNEKANKAIDDTDKKGQGLSGTFGSMIGTVGKWALAAGTAAATVAAAIGVKAVSAAAAFEKGMANVATLLDGKVDEKIKNLGGAVKQLQKDTGTSADLLTDGLYQVISAFGDTADSMNILETATKGAKAGNATVTDSVNLLSAVTKGYGDTSSEAAKKASDLAFLTVKLGQTTFPELAASMGKVIPLASTMKVKQEELFGAMATLTGVTGNTAEVTTQLRGTIQGFLQPTTQMAAALKKLGYENGQVALESEGLGGILNSLKESVGGNEVAFASLFGSVEAKNAVLALTGSQAENFAEKTKAMGEAAGATEAAFEKQQQTVTAMMEKIKEYANVIFVNLGEKILPKLAEFLGWVIDYMPQIEAVFEVVFDNIGIGLEWVISWIGRLIGWIREWKDDNSEQLSEIWQKFQWLFADLKYFITGFVEYAKWLWSKFGDDILAIIKADWGLISAVIRTALNLITDIFHIFGALFRGDWKEVWEGIKFLVSDILNGMINIIKAALGVIGANFNLAFTGVKTIVLGIFDGIVQGIKGAINSIIRAINGMINAMNRINFSIPKWVPVIGGKEWGFNIPKVPMLAKGIDFFEGGRAIVGEYEPEIVDLPRGSRVTPISKILDAPMVTGASKSDLSALDKAVDRIVDAINNRLKLEIKSLLNIEHYEASDEADVDILTDSLRRNIAAVVAANG